MLILLLKVSSDVASSARSCEVKNLKSVMTQRHSYIQPADITPCNRVPKINTDVPDGDLPLFT